MRKKETPNPSRVRGRGVEVSETLFYVWRNLFFLCPFLRKEVSTVANRIMGITVEIGGDTTKLQTALKGVNGQIKSTQ